MTQVSASFSRGIGATDTAERVERRVGGAGIASLRSELRQRDEGEIFWLEISAQIGIAELLSIIVHTR